MKKWICKNEICKEGCELTVNYSPVQCPRGIVWAKWQEFEEFNKGFVKKALREAQEKIAGKSPALPKLTAEVFEREDCPADTKIAIVNKSGSACWGSFASAKPVFIGWVGHGAGEWKTIPGEWDATDWQNSIIERPAVLPEWAEIGGYVYDDRNGYGKIVSGSAKSCYIEFDGGAGDFVPEAFAGLKQARLRPYNAEEMRGLVGKVIEEKKTGDISFVTGYCNGTEKIYAGQNNFVAELLLSNYTIDGSPCGVFEHLENGEWVE